MVAGILTRELWTFYQAFVAGRKARLPGAYSRTATTRCGSGNLSPAACSMLNSLTGKNSSPMCRRSICRLIIEGRRARVFPAAGRAIALSASLTAALNELSRREGVSPFMTLLAAFNFC